MHDWLNTMAGAERVLEAIYEIYPSDIFTLIANRDALKGTIFESANIYTSFIQALPFALRHYRKYLPLMPLAIEQFDLSNYDLILSSSHAVAKGILTSAKQIHISYIHTPIRYAWDLQSLYLRDSGLDKGLKGIAARLILHYLRHWDRSTAAGVDYFIANSRYVAQRIWRCYRREATVIYPPVDVDFFGLAEDRDDYFITASRMVPYKRLDIIAEAFSGMPWLRLLVIGDGPEMKKIKAKASTNVEILGWQSREALRSYLQRSRGFIFAAEEDFGILPVEAQACGVPVIAYRKGGVTETVVEGQTGLFFAEQSAGSVKEAVRRFILIEDTFEPTKIMAHAQAFSKERFKRELRSFVEEILSNSKAKG